MRRRLLIALALALAAGCSSSGSTGAAPTPPVIPSTPAPPTLPPSPKPQGPVTIAFGGDTHFVGASARALDGFGPIATYLRRADLAMVNLETAVTTRGIPADKDFTFRSPPSSFDALRNAGIDVATMANNHGMDYGLIGLTDSLHYAHEAHFPIVGIGRDAHQAFAPYRTRINGLRIAVIGATQVLDTKLAAAWSAGPGKPGLASAYDVPRLLAAVRHAHRHADVVVVNLHWGSELVACPTDAQRTLMPQLLHAGADAVVGSHAHILLGGGWQGRKYVDYGLGNFVFYSAGGVTAQSGVLTLTFERHEVTRAQWRPAAISSGVPAPLHGTAAHTARQAWKSLRGCTGLAAQPAAGG